jgi:hypothetical protein
MGFKQYNGWEERTRYMKQQRFENPFMYVHNKPGMILETMDISSLKIFSWK